MAVTYARLPPTILPLAPQPASYTSQRSQPKASRAPAPMSSSSSFSTSFPQPGSSSGITTTPSSLPAPPQTLYLYLLHRTAPPFAFIYGVISTKIYCLPLCPARLARRANIAFFPDPPHAANAGFRACKRCRPDECFPWPMVVGAGMAEGAGNSAGKDGVQGAESGTTDGNGGNAGSSADPVSHTQQQQRQQQQQTPLILPAQRRQLAAVKRACELLAEHRQRLQDQPNAGEGSTSTSTGSSSTLRVAEVAREVGMTRWHFARVFRKVMGMGPGEWARQRRTLAAREGAASGGSASSSSAAAGAAVIGGTEGGSMGGGESARMGAEAGEGVGGVDGSGSEGESGSSGSSGNGDGSAGGARAADGLEGGPALDLGEWGEELDEWMWCDSAEGLDWAAAERLETAFGEDGMVESEGLQHSRQWSAEGPAGELDWDRFLDLTMADVAASMPAPWQ